MGWQTARLSLTEDLSEVVVDRWDDCSDRMVRTLHCAGCNADGGIAGSAVNIS